MPPKIKKTQDTEVYFSHLGMHQDWNQVQKTCSQPVLQILVQKQGQTLVPLQNLKVKRSIYFFHYMKILSERDVLYLVPQRLHTHKKHHRFCTVYMLPGCIWHLWQWIHTTFFLLKNEFLLNLILTFLNLRFKLLPHVVQCRNNC